MAQPMTSRSPLGTVKVPEPKPGQARAVYTVLPPGQTEVEGPWQYLVLTEPQARAVRWNLYLTGSTSVLRQWKGATR